MIKILIYFLQSVLNGTQICIIGDGTNIIDFVYVNDVAKTHVEAAKILPQRKYKGDAFVEDKKMADAQWTATIVDRK